MGSLCQASNAMASVSSAWTRMVGNEKGSRSSACGRMVSSSVVVEPDTPLESFEELDAMRRKITSGLRELHPPWEVDVVFVADKSLA